MLIIYILIFLFIGLLIYQFYLVEGYTDKEVNNKINEVVDAIGKKIKSIDSTTSAINARLTTLENNMNGVKTTNDTLSPLVPQLTTLAGQQSDINDLIENSRDMDDSIAEAQIAAGQGGDY